MPKATYRCQSAVKLERFRLSKSKSFKIWMLIVLNLKKINHLFEKTRTTKKQIFSSIKGFYNKLLCNYLGFSSSEPREKELNKIKNHFHKFLPSSLKPRKNEALNLITKKARVVKDNFSKMYIRKNLEDYLTNEDTMLMLEELRKNFEYDDDNWFFPCKENCLELIKGLESILGNQYLVFENEVLKENGVNVDCFAVNKNVFNINASETKKLILANLLFYDNQFTSDKPQNITETKIFEIEISKLTMVSYEKKEIANDEN